MNPPENHLGPPQPGENNALEDEEGALEGYNLPESDKFAAVVRPQRMHSTHTPHGRSGRHPNLVIPQGFALQFRSPTNILHPCHVATHSLATSDGGRAPYVSDRMDSRKDR